MPDPNAELLQQIRDLMAGIGQGTPELQGLLAAGQDVGKAAREALLSGIAAATAAAAAGVVEVSIKIALKLPGASPGSVCYDAEAAAKLAVEKLPDIVIGLLLSGGAVAGISGAAAVGAVAGIGTALVITGGLAGLGALAGGVLVAGVMAASVPMLLYVAVPLVASGAYGAVAVGVGAAVGGASLLLTGALAAGFFAATTVAVAAGGAAIATAVAGGTVMAAEAAAVGLLLAVLGPDPLGQLRAAAKRGAEQVEASVKRAGDEVCRATYIPGLLRVEADPLRIDLDREYALVAEGGWAVLSMRGDRALYRLTEVAEAGRTAFLLSGKTTRLALDMTPAGFEVRDTVVYTQSELLPRGETPLTTPVEGATIELARRIPDLPAGRTVIVSGKPTRLISERALWLRTRAGAFLGTTAPGESLQVMGAPETLPDGATRRWHVRTATGLVGFFELDPVNATPMTWEPARPTDDVVTEVAVVLTSSTNEARTTLGLKMPLRNVYDRTTVIIHANVAFASHGETVRGEILGDGDAAATFQRFALAKKPVTHVPGAGPDGLVSSVRVFVNDVRWDEVQTLYGRGATDEAYAVRIADDGTLTVQFGDGRTGARLPSGRANVAATYRQGLGLMGRLPAGALTTLLTRPAGLRAVTNPAPAEGGADPETSEHAKENAPSTVRTFGRAVSLRDFEDLVRASGEVAKAHATWVWDGTARVVHLTVAAQGGEPFSPEALGRLRTALAAGRDPNHRVRIDNVTRVAIRLEAVLNVSERRVAAGVLAAARAALTGALSFDALAFGAGVHLSDVYRVLQTVDGVEWVDVNALHFKNTDPAFLADRGVTTTQPQGHLRIFPARLLGPPTALVVPAEQAWVEAPADLVLSTQGGLA